MTREEFIRDFAKEYKTTYSASKEWIDAVLDHLRQKLLDEEEVSLYGFGVFTQRRYKGRVGRNMKTMEPIQLPDTVTIFFKPSQKLKDELEYTITAEETMNSLRRKKEG